MAEVAVAVLDVDEREARPLGLPRGADEVVDEPGDLVVRQHMRRLVGPEAAVEHRVAIERDRLVAPLVVRPGVAARVDELEADEQVVIAAEPLDMLGDEPLAHRRDGPQGLLGEE